MNCILTAYSGEHGRDLAAITRDRIGDYAHKCKAEYLLLYPPDMTFPELMLAKMEFVKSTIERGHRVLWIDGDILIRADSPNLFDIVPVGSFGAVNEGALGSYDQLKFRNDHIVQTCREEGLQIPQTNSRYFNCGMFMAEPLHAMIFEKRYAFSHHDWCEQSVVNARLMLGDYKICSLPECFNRFVYWGAKPRLYEEISYFLHYAGAPSKEQKLIDMQTMSRRF